MVFKSTRFPLYLGMAVLTISIITVAFTLATKSNTTQTESNAQGIPSPTVKMVPLPTRASNY